MRRLADEASHLLARARAQVAGAGPHEEVVPRRRSRDLFGYDQRGRLVDPLHLLHRVAAEVPRPVPPVQTAPPRPGATPAQPVPEGDAQVLHDIARRERAVGSEFQIRRDHRNGEPPLQEGMSEPAAICLKHPSFDADPEAIHI